VHEHLHFTHILVWSRKNELAVFSGLFFNCSVLLTCKRRGTHTLFYIEQRERWKGKTKKTVVFCLIGILHNLLLNTKTYTRNLFFTRLQHHRIIALVLLSVWRKAMLVKLRVFINNTMRITFVRSTKGNKPTGNSHVSNQSSPISATNLILVMKHHVPC
jgi:hypothetical protein